MKDAERELVLLPSPREASTSPRCAG